MEALPSKLDLLQSSIVSIDYKHKKVITNSLQIASYFGKRPSDVNRRIARLVKKGLCKVTQSYYLNQQGKKQNYYELSRDIFLLVVLGFTGVKADQFKADFIQLFNRLEAELHQWQTGRKLTVNATKQANDELQWLKSELAKVIPTSKRCTMIFNHFQIAINKAVTGKGIKIDRNNLQIDQLNQIERLEEGVQAKVKQLRMDGVEPEKIRDDVLGMIKRGIFYVGN